MSANTRPARAAHTPLPWRIDIGRNGAMVSILAEQVPLTVCCAVVYGGLPDAELIVRAVNNHAALVAALRDLSDNPHDTGAQIRAAAVLAQAEGRRP